MQLMQAYPPATKGTLVVWGFLASAPFGGMTWQVLQHLAALRRLGFDVWYVEDSDTPVYDPVTYWPTQNCDANVAYLANYMARLDLAERWIFRPPGHHDHCLGGRDMAGLRQLYRDADAVLNLCGSHEPGPEHQDIRCLVYLETDPVANQVRVATGEARTMALLKAHHHIFTYGENLGAADCLVPVEHFCWQPTRPPVCLDWWATTAPPRADMALTTVANWLHTGKDIVWQGETYYWSKHYEFLRFLSLPAQAALPLELAIGRITPEDIAHLQQHGWRTVPSVDIAQPEAYRAYIRASGGEFTVAKDQNIRLRSGWFSDRSACYLAAGRPVITQDTGFGNILPTGAGLFAFRTAEEALAAIETVTRDYARQSAAARDLAQAYFAAERVLGDVLRRVGLL
ncbi:MAG: glycosyltransferase [Candidatus Tectimicrobiota bacterium]